MISSSSSERVWATPVAEFFSTEAALVAPELPLDSATALATVRLCAWACIRWSAIRTRSSGLSILPAASVPT